MEILSKDVTENTPNSARFNMKADKKKRSERKLGPV